MFKILKAVDSKILNPLEWIIMENRKKLMILDKILAILLGIGFPLFCLRCFRFAIADTIFQGMEPYIYSFAGLCIIGTLAPLIPIIVKILFKRMEKAQSKSAYLNVRNTFKYLIKNSKLSRSSILSFKKELKSCLGANASRYKKYRFKNDANEVYTLLKDKSLRREHYLRLNNFLKMLHVSEKHKQQIFETTISQ